MYAVDAEYVLTNIPVVLERILGYLPILDIYKAKGVCKAWKTSAEYVIAIKEKIPLLELLTFDEELDENEIFVKFKMSKKERSWNRDSKKYNDFLDWKNNWRTLPKTGICVCFSLYNKQKSTNFEAKNFLRYLLPPQSKLLVLHCFDNCECELCVDRQYWADETSFLEGYGLYNYLSFPSKPGSFSVDFFNLKRDHLAEDQDKFFKDVNEELAHPDTKMVFVCAEKLDEQTQLSPFLRDALNPAAQRGVVVIGCLYDSKIIYSSDSSYADEKNLLQDMVLMFFKGKNVRAASVQVGFQVKTLAGLENYLKKLQSSVVSLSSDCPVKCKNRTETGYCDSCMSQTIGLMVAGCGRADSFEWYDERTEDTCNREQETFRKMIPNVPFLGAYGYVQIGATINIGSEDEMINDISVGNLDGIVFAVVMLK